MRYFPKIQKSLTCNCIDKRTFDTSIQVTFTNDAPSKFKDLPSLFDMYQGGYFKVYNLQNYSTDPEDDSLIHTAIANVSSDLVFFYIDDFNSIMEISVSPDLNEPFSVDVTARDPFGNSYSQSMDINGVTGCTQDNCNACRGLGPRDCIG